MLSAPMDKEARMQEQMGNVSREMEKLRKKQKEMLEVPGPPPGQFLLPALFLVYYFLSPFPASLHVL